MQTQHDTSRQTIKTGAIRREYRERGCVVIDDFLSPMEISEILASVDDYKDSGREIIQVNQRDILCTQVFKTTVGRDCEDYITAFSDLWRGRIREVSKDLADCDLLLIDAPAIGINVNMTEPSGQLTYHYNCNVVTGILYL
jgi:hypothetical protein